MPSVAEEEPTLQTKSVRERGKMILLICAVIWFLSGLLWLLTLGCPFCSSCCPLKILPLSCSGSAAAGKRQPHFNAGADLVGFSEESFCLMNLTDGTAERKALFCHDILVMSSEAISERSERKPYLGPRSFNFDFSKGKSCLNESPSYFYAWALSLWQNLTLY